MAHFYDRELLETEVFDGEIPEESYTEPEEEAKNRQDGELVFKLTLEDGRTVSCRCGGIFPEEEREYAVLEGKEGEIHIMELSCGEEDEILLLPVESEEIRQRIFYSYISMFERRGDSDDRDQNGKEN